jgi:primosomal protein N'
MVNERFSSYNKCIPLFFWSNIATVLKHKKILPDSKKNKSEQHLFLFPSVLSISQYNQNHDEYSPLILTGQSSDVQQAKAYRSLHNNESQLVYATHSKIFQDRNNLKSINIIDEYSPLYQTYQDPRYNIIAVLQKMREIYNI